MVERRELLRKDILGRLQNPPPNGVISSVPAGSDSAREVMDIFKGLGYKDPKRLGDEIGDSGRIRVVSLSSDDPLVQGVVVQHRIVYLSEEPTQDVWRFPLKLQPSQTPPVSEYR